MCVCVYVKVYVTYDLPQGCEETKKTDTIFCDLPSSVKATKPSMAS